jgi:PQQ-like domain/EF hand
MAIRNVLAGLILFSCAGVASASGTTLIVSSGLGDLVRVDTTSGKIVSLGTDNCGYPNGAVVARGNELIVAQQCGSLLHVDAATGAVKSTIPTVTMIQDMAFDGRNLIAVTSHSTLLHIDPDTGAVIDQRSLVAPGLALSLVDGTVYITTSFITYAAPAASGSAVVLTDFGMHNGFDAVGVAGDLLLICNVSGEVDRIDRATGVIKGTWIYPTDIEAIVVDGSSAYLGSVSGRILQIDTATGAVLGSIETGIQATNLAVLMPCVADANGDGQINVADFSAFMGAFARGDRRADANGDGALNVQDFMAFMAAFARGCP